MNATRKLVGTVMLVVTLLLVAKPAKADYSSCVDSWIATCDATLADASWWEKPIIGAACVALIAGCTI